MSSSLVNNTCIIKNLFFPVHIHWMFIKFCFIISFIPPPPPLKKEVKF